MRMLCRKWAASGRSHMLTFYHRRRFGICIFLVLLFAFSACAWSGLLARDTSFLINHDNKLLIDAIPTQKEEELVRVVDKFVDVGRFQKAATLLRASGDLHSPYLFFQLLLCCSFARDGEALTSSSDEWIASKVPVSNQFQALVYAFAGLGYEWKKEYEKALEYYNKSIELDPASAALGSKEALVAVIGQPLSDKPGVNFEPPRKLSRLEERIKLRAGQISSYSFIETPQEYSSIVNADLRRELIEAEEKENSGSFEDACRIYARLSKRSDFDASMWNQYALCLLTSLRNIEDPPSENLPFKNKQDNMRVVPGSSPEEVKAQVDRIFPEAVKNAYRKPAKADNNAFQRTTTAENKAKTIFRNAENAFRTAIRLNDGDWRLWNNLGMIEVMLNDKMGYAQSFRMALSYKDLPPGQRDAIRHAAGMRQTIELLKERYKKTFGSESNDGDDE
ncbi:MAG TPA: tetratricopeptide repeat protein [Candidatus Melainabacteria bacterium]|nr:tetratricopeptide repeat protein [Candidatus Melainabacteria bacterium]HIN65860.1 tetratricopeptide repeat protein [Candidatus Obscuribacterales bacterium]